MFSSKLSIATGLLAGASPSVDAIKIRKPRLDHPNPRYQYNIQTTRRNCPTHTTVGGFFIDAECWTRPDIRDGLTLNMMNTLGYISQQLSSNSSYGYGLTLNDNPKERAMWRILNSLTLRDGGFGEYLKQILSVKRAETLWEIYSIYMFVSDELKHIIPNLDPKNCSNLCHECKMRLAKSKVFLKMVEDFKKQNGSRSRMTGQSPQAYQTYTKSRSLEEKRPVHCQNAARPSSPASNSQMPKEQKDFLKLKLGESFTDLSCCLWNHYNLSKNSFEPGYTFRTDKVKSPFLKQKLNADTDGAFKKEVWGIANAVLEKAQEIRYFPSSREDRNDHGNKYYRGLCDNANFVQMFEEMLNYSEMVSEMLKGFQQPSQFSRQR